MNEEMHSTSSNFKMNPSHLPKTRVRAEQKRQEKKTASDKKKREEGQRNEGR